MVTPKNKKAFVVAGSIGAVVVVALGGRLAYTEDARRAMDDYDRKVKAAVNDPALKAAWAEKIRVIERRWAPKDEPWAGCDEATLQKYADQQQPVGSAQSWYVPTEASCYARKLAGEELNREAREWEIEELGTYEGWAYDQSGLAKYHRWLKYPLELRRRVRDGEKGLMLGEWWKWVSQYVF
jgi:hypothetical protein